MGRSFSIATVGWNSAVTDVLFWFSKIHFKMKGLQNAYFLKSHIFAF